MLNTITIDEITRKQLQAARGYLGLSLLELSKLAGISESTLSRLESGETSTKSKSMVIIVNKLNELGIRFVDNGIVGDVSSTD